MGNLCLETFLLMLSDLGNDPSACSAVPDGELVVLLESVRRIELALGEILSILRMEMPDES